MLLTLIKFSDIFCWELAKKISLGFLCWKYAVKWWKDSHKYIFGSSDLKAPGWNNLVLRVRDTIGPSVVWKMKKKNVFHFSSESWESNNGVHKCSICFILLEIENCKFKFHLAILGQNLGWKKVNIIFEAVQNLLKPSYFDENCLYVHSPGTIVLCKLFTMLDHS